MIEVGGVPIEVGQPFEFWALCAGLLIAYFWSIKKHGPLFVPAPGERAVSRAKIASFVGGVLALLFVSGSPWHDIGEQGLFFFHTTEHMVQGFVVAPLLLMGLPDWMFRMLVRQGPIRWIVTRLGKPLMAAIIFNAAFALLHWPVIVDAMIRNTAAHGASHFLWLAASIIMWLPIASPDHDLVRPLSTLSQMGYLLVMTILPTIPSSFLTFGEQPVYKIYTTFPRMWGLPAVEDMQIAGLIMKIGGGFLLWSVITVKFFRWAAAESRRELAGKSPDTPPSSPDAEPVRQLS